MKSELRSELREMAKAQLASLKSQAQDAVEMAKAQLASLKSQMKEMVEQNNATPLDLTEFMEQNYAELLSMPDHPSADGGR
ncbi:hypothetical protein ACP70R_016906 [Stipagrostis hirtigluma subsp. patula]